MHFHCKIWGTKFKCTGIVIILPPHLCRVKILDDEFLNWLTQSAEAWNCIVPLLKTTKQGLWVLSPITSVKGALKRNLLKSSMNNRNDYDKPKQHQCPHGHLTVVLNTLEKLWSFPLNTSAISHYLTSPRWTECSCLSQYHYEIQSHLFSSP